MTDPARGPVRATVAVLICTFRRPEGLRALLASLDRLTTERPDAGLVVEPVLVVVDNDGDAPLAAAGHDVATWSRWPLTYAVERTRGVVAARNRALDLAPATADYLAFVDDDEEVSPDWLLELVATYRANGAAAVQGPVEPRYARPPSAMIERCGLYRLGPYADGERLGFAATNNSLVARADVEAHGLRFDMHFNLSGGEDQDFFTRLARVTGRPLVASARAVVTDVIPAHRMTMRWMLKRSFRMGNSLGHIARLRGGTKGALVRFAKALAWIARGAAITLLLLPVGRDPGRKGLLQMVWGTGSLLGLAGHQVLEYAPPRPGRAGPAPSTGSRSETST